MKKIVMYLLVLAVMPFTACSDDDNVTQDPIIGKWHWSGLTIIENDKTTEVDELSDCAKTSRLEFKADGTGMSEFFYDYENNCLSEGRNSFLWENLGDNTYKFIYPDDDNESSSDKLEFKANTFVVIYTETQGSTVYKYIETYTRVE